MPNSIEQFTIIPGVIILIMLAIFLVVIIRQGWVAGAGVGAGVVAVAVAVTVTLLLLRELLLVGQEAAETVVAVAGVVAVAVAGTVAVAGVGVVAGVVVVAGVGTVAGVVAVAVAGVVWAAGVVAVLWIAVVETRVGAVGVAVVLVVVLAGIYIAWRALAGDEKYNQIRQIAVFFASTGGTNFCNANLTDADFTGATLKCTKFMGANLTRTRFYEAKKLLLARVGKSILAPLPIRSLLVTGNGRNKSYINANLRGANLMGADLNGANLKGANIMDATFQGANLEWVNFSFTEAINTDFTRALMTGVSLEGWNIESSTKLDNVDARFVYLLEHPKPGTDDRERRPSSGEFGAGEFTKLFQEVLTTIDLIFRNGVDWKAFTATFQKVQVENEDTELTIQSIENKGDGVVVVRVSAPPDANKEKIHSEFTQNYEFALKAIEEKYQAIVEGKDKQVEEKDKQITIYREQLEYERQRERQQSADVKEIIKILASRPVNLPINEAEVSAIAQHKSPGNIIMVTLGNGDLNQGFSSVIAQVWTDGNKMPTQYPAELPPAPKLLELYRNWQSMYNTRLTLPRSRMKKPPTQTENFSFQEFNALAGKLEEGLNKWLISEPFIPIDRRLRENFNRADQMRVIIQSPNPEVRKLPWHLWDFFKAYRQAEIAVSAPFYDRVAKIARPRTKIRILSILGDSQGINTDTDKQILSSIDAQVEFLEQPSRQKLDAQLWDEQGWDILCFSGHSSSQMDGSSGWMNINQVDRLTIPDLKNALSAAIERGLQLAIFNSCDGLGLASQLADLHIPQIIVMRELVPDVVAQEFLKNFVTAFAGGKSFYMAVREAREKLQPIEEHYPCVTWLPVICQNPAEVPPTWESLRRGKPETH